MWAGGLCEAGAARAGVCLIAIIVASAGVRRQLEFPALATIWSAEQTSNQQGPGNLPANVLDNWIFSNFPPNQLEIPTTFIEGDKI